MYSNRYRRKKEGGAKTQAEKRRVCLPSHKATQKAVLTLGKRGKARRQQEAYEQKTLLAQVDVRRIGVGYRVRREKENNQDVLVFNVGYADRKKIVVPSFMEATVDVKQASRQRKATEALMEGRTYAEIMMERMNVASRIEKVKPINVYSGNGIICKHKRDKVKRKSTKVDK